jgi:hypothetical protein
MEKVGRKKEKGAPWFSHLRKMRKDPKVLALRNRFNNLEGYAVFNMFLEFLCETEEIKITLDIVNLELMAGDFEIPVEYLKEILNFCVKIKLIQKKGKVFSCTNLKERLQPMFHKRDTAALTYLNRVNKKKKGPIVSASEMTHSIVEYSNSININQETKNKLPMFKKFDGFTDRLFNELFVTYEHKFINQDIFLTALKKIHRRVDEQKKCGARYVVRCLDNFVFAEEGMLDMVRKACADGFKKHIKKGEEND